MATDDETIAMRRKADHWDLAAQHSEHVEIGGVGEAMRGEKAQAVARRHGTLRRRSEQLHFQGQIQPFQHLVPRGAVEETY